MLLRDGPAIEWDVKKGGTLNTNQQWKHFIPVFVFCVFVQHDQRSSCGDPASQRITLGGQLTDSLQVRERNKRVVGARQGRPVNR